MFTVLLWLRCERLRHESDLCLVVVSGVEKASCDGVMKTWQG